MKKKTFSTLLVAAFLSLTGCSMFTGQQGPQGPQGERGPAGQNGKDGKDGVSVVSITKTGSDGPQDKYTITYSDGTTSTFTINNGVDGQNGAAGPQGQQGADGHTPVITIGANGNWIVDGVDTGIKAQGAAGQNGKDGVSIISIKKTSSNGLVDTYTITYSNGSTSTFTVNNGAQGEQGIQGEAGADGHTPTITIGANGNWFVDGVDTGIKAQGPKGDTGETGQQGVSVVSITKTGSDGLVDTYTITYSDNTTSTFTVTNGSQGIQGQPGEDGHTPAISIGDNGNWFVDGVDTGIKAQGPQGEAGQNGVSIVSIEKTSTDGLVDTYTITYSNGSTSTFTVNNGAQGEQGIQGEAGADGHTPTITIGANGNWFVDGVDTGIKAQGPKGDTGETGQQGEQGVSIVSTTIDENGDLIITYSDGTTQNAGHLKDVETYTVNFYIGEEVVATRVVPAYSKVSRPTEEEIAGYNVNYWYTVDGSYQDRWNFQGCVVTEDTNLYADYTAKQYTVSFVDAQFGHSVDDYIVTYNAEYTLPSISETGHTFQGWYDSEGVKINDTGIFRITHDITLYAHWSAITYQARLNPNGGLINQSTAIFNLSITYGNQYSFPTPTRSGYYFEGWFIGEEAFPATGTWLYTSSLNISAKWSASRTFTVARNGGLGDSSDITLTIGAEYTLPTPTPPQYYNFDGWYIGDIGEGNYVPLTGTWEYEGDATRIIAHYYHDSLGYSLYTNSVTINSAVWASSDPSKERVIPGYIHGLPTSIGSAYYSKTSIHEVLIEEGCYQINGYPFRSCTNLIKITIPSTMTEIKSSVSYQPFDNCYKLATIINKSSLQFTIGSDSYGRIAKYAREIVRSSLSSRQITDLNGFARYITDDEDIVINYVGEINNNSEGKHIKTVTDGVTKIGHHAFNNSAGILKGPFDELTLPVSLQVIESDAFYYNKNLKTLNYQGTIEQWNNIILETNWNRDAGFTSVHCSNGEVNL